VSPSYKAEDCLDVWIKDRIGLRKVGVLERQSEPGYPHQSQVLFHYDQGLSEADAISLLMPVRRETYRTNRAGLVDILHPIFDQNLPEGALRAYLTQRYRKIIPDMGDFDLLRLVGQHSIGRVMVAPHRTAVEALFQPKLPAASVSELLANKDSERLLNALFERLAPYSGVSGVQPKVLLQNRELASSSEIEPVKPSCQRRITLQGDRHILKAAAQDYPWLAVNEYLCLYAARASGLDTVQATLSDDGGVLAVTRFDYAEDGAPLGFEDGCALAGLTASQKYSGSYEQLVQHLMEFLPLDAQALAKRTLFHLVALSCLIENGDGHLKNFGLLYADPTCPARLAPAFDLVCTTAYLPEDHLALSLGGSKRFPIRKELALFGRHTCGLTPSQIERVFEQVFRGIVKASIEAAYCCDKFPEFSRQCGAAIQHIWERNVKRYS